MEFKVAGLSGFEIYVYHGYAECLCILQYRDADHFNVRCIVCIIIRRHSSDVYLGMSPTQNDVSYLMY